MSRPIKLTADFLDAIEKEFKESMRNMKMFDGKVSYNKVFKYDKNDGGTATVKFTSVAFAKMMMLVQTFSKEVAWHGVVHRDENASNVFIITDILVYPQVVTGATVNTDQEEYTKWLYSPENDDVFDDIRMQGHSHVNMSTSPSGVDTSHQEKILSQLDDDMYYIFMIWNKRFEHTVKIFDLANNTLYEDDDIFLGIGEDGVDLDAFIKEAKERVKDKPAIGFTAPAATKTCSVKSMQGVQTKTKKKAKASEEKSYWNRKGYSYNEEEDYYDDDDYYNGYYY